MPQQFVITPEGGYSLRLVGPNLGGPSTTVLNTAMQARWLTPAGMRIPTTDQFSDGSWTARLGDSGEGTITFPATDGWRSTFAGTETGRLYWIEIYGPSDRPELVFVITKITRTRQSITVEGFTGSFLLKSAYEGDFQAVMAPRDVIERYTRAKTVGAANPGFSLTASTSTATQNFTIASNGASSWSASGSVLAAINVGANVVVAFGVYNGASKQAEVAFDATANTVTLTVGALTAVKPMPSLPSSLPASVTLDCDGRWIRAFVNGQPIGVLPTFGGNIDTLKSTLTVGILSMTINWGPSVFRQLTGFLLRGAAKGDYVLPGTAATYPFGGLHGRYYNDLDLAGSANRLLKLLSPARVPYNDRLDQTVANPAAPTPGAAATNWSARWFGAVYLKAGGSYTFTLSGVIGASRLWVGKTAFGDQIVDDWSAFGGSHTVTGSYTPAATGWYPIVLEYGHDTGAAGITLAFTPPNIGNYADPGGTTITANGATSVTIPATSLSPLGCVDQRFQGVSFFQIVQDTAKAFGYQWRDDPRSLESGEFPCQLIPLARVGRDTDEILGPGDLDSDSPLYNAQSIVDATDQATSIRGNGAGVPDGKGSQITAEVLDVAALNAALFDLQAWSDHTDASFLALLQATLNTELGLRLAPWQQISGDPLARDRLADTFPLTGALAGMFWQPGDGVRIQIPDIGVVDQTPRQLLQFTRQFTPEGRTGANAGFRARPKSDVWALRNLLFAALRPQRNFQHQYVTIPGVYVGGVLVTVGNTTGVSVTALQAQDKVVQAVVRVTVNSPGAAINILINGTDQTGNLGGPWSAAPTEIDITQFAVPQTGAANRLDVQFKNTGAVQTQIDFQPFVTVLR